MKCPHCHLENPATAQRCDCGYDFEAKTLKESYLERDRKQRGPQPSEDVRRRGQRDIRLGAAVFVLGVLVTVGTHTYAVQTGAREYTIAYGAIIWGAIWFIRGLDRSRSGIERTFWRNS